MKPHYRYNWKTGWWLLVNAGYFIQPIAYKSATKAYGCFDNLMHRFTEVK